MTRIITLLAILALIALPAHAAIWYLRVPADQVDAFMLRLDVLKGPSPYTLRYTEPVVSWMATETTVLIPVDERAESVLTADEWAAKMTEMPVEFQRQIW